MLLEIELDAGPCSFDNFENLIKSFRLCEMVHGAGVLSLP